MQTIEANTEEVLSIEQMRYISENLIGKKASVRLMDPSLAFFVSRYFGDIPVWPDFFLRARYSRDIFRFLRIHLPLLPFFAPFSLSSPAGSSVPGAALDSRR